MGDIFAFKKKKKHCLHFNIGIFFFNKNCVRFLGITNETFVANASWLVFKHCQLFIPHHAIKVVEAITKYRTNMGIISNSSSLEE